MRKVLSVLALLGILFILVAPNANAAKPNPLPTPGPAVASATVDGPTPPATETTQSTQSATPLTAEAFTPGPYWCCQRWITPVICVDNQTSWAMQTHVLQWGTGADIDLQYENCAGWADSHRIDVVFGNDSSKGCYYHFWRTDANSKLTRMIVYLNLNPRSGPDTCWGNVDAVGVNHAKSNSIGVALGLQVFGSGSGPYPNEYPPYYVSVMRYTSWWTVSYAQDGDRQTFAWYNNL